MKTRANILNFGMGVVFVVTAGLFFVPLESMSKACTCVAVDQNDKTYEGGAPKRSIIRGGLMVAKINCSYICQVANEAPENMRAQHTVQYYKWLETQTTLTCLGYVAKNCHTNVDNPGRPLCSLVAKSFNPRSSSSADLKTWAKKNNCNYF